jgi:3-oxoacyl-[acyl-carrier-protein] synthase III
MAASGLTVGTALYVLDELPLRLRKTSPSKKESSDVAISDHREEAVTLASIATTRTRKSKPTSTEEIALEAAKNCLAQAPCPLEDIGVLIFTGVYKSGFIGEPSYAAVLAGKLLPHSEKLNGGGTPLAFDMHDGSNGFMSACEMMRTMLTRRSIRAGLVIAAEFDNNRLLEGYPQLGIAEMASAAVLMRASEAGVQVSNWQSYSFDEHTDAFRANLVCIKPAHVRFQRQRDFEARLRGSIVRALGCYLPSVSRSLADFDEFYFPQVSSDFLNALASQLEIPRERIVDVTVPEGDLYTSSLPSALEHVTKRHPKGNKVCLAVSVGSGINVRCGVITC